MTAGRLACLSLSLFVLLIALGGASAFADEESTGSAPLPTSHQVGEAIESPGSSSIEPVLTDPSAAEGVALQGLGRSEALELLRGVFGPELQAPAGIFDELHVEKFLAPNVALIPAGAQPELTEGSPSEEPGDSGYEGATLMDSTVPLGTEDASGQLEAVDLSLEATEGQLKPANALIDVGIPGELGEGIELPEVGIRIQLADAPEERAPSTAEGSVAFYPNVAGDTDLAVAPTPTGVETLTQMRGPDSPDSETFELAIPNGAALEQEGGGARVVHEGETLLEIPPPSAIDSSGAEVPVTLTVHDDSLTLALSPDESTSYPIAVDPLFQTYEWYVKHNTEEIHYSEPVELEKEWSFLDGPGGWATTHISHGSLWTWGATVYNESLSPIPWGADGLVVANNAGTAAGDEASFVYTVPRYFTDPQERGGAEPSSFISRMTTTDQVWKALSQGNSPYAYVGLWGGPEGWVSFWKHEGLLGHSVNEMNSIYNFPNPLNSANVKVAEAGLHSLENVSSHAEALLFVGAATVELAEPESVVPTFSATGAPAQWVNENKALVSFTANDTGLGVSSVTVSGEGSSPPSWKGAQGCTGVPSKPCPYSWKNSIYVEPTKLPTGIDKLKLVAEDPLAHVSSPSIVQVKVDHTAPELTLSGPLNEQAKLGTTLPKYALNLSATDGTAEHPQSGAAKTAIKVDGSVVDEYSPGCTTQNCTINREWTLESSKYAPGPHTIEVTTTDAVGLTRTKTLAIELHPTSPPTLNLSGSMTEQATLGTERPRYTLKTSASAAPQPEGGTLYVRGVPMFMSSFGSSGTGNGQFTNPGALTVDSQRNALVADSGAGRIEKFNVAGEYLAQIGTKGSGNGQLLEPAGLALDSAGNIWVADAGNNRIEKFNEKGEYLAKYGTKGVANGQFEHPEAVAIDAKGNIWVADTRNGRLQEFTAAGEFIKVVGTKGTAAGQLYEPDGISIAAGNVWVADWHNNVVSAFSEAGTYLRQFGAEGTGNGQFTHPAGISADGQGKLWVVDAGNNRVEEFNEKGSFINQFGAKGTGAGQFTMTRPVGIATDVQGDIWVTDNSNKRVERWHTVGPNYASSFGSKGSGNGQLSAPGGVAIDPQGNIWVANTGNNRIEKFNEKGEYLAKYGFKGSENGAFLEPTALAIDAKGNVWVADAGNNRIEKFSEKGAYLAKYGTKGTANGQFEHPEGIAIDGAGNVWVSDTRNHRLEEFKENGEFIRTAGAAGTSGALGEPIGIAIGPESSVWVADYSANKVEKFNEKGEYLAKYGAEGSGNLQFLHPTDVYVDANSDLWTVDSGNNRVTEMWLGALFMNQFGSEGAGVGQFSLGRTAGIAVGAQGDLWVSDAGNNRIQRWHQTSSRSEVKNEVTLDGKLVDSAQIGCANESCSATHEWTLESALYSAGKHTVVVTATDGVGRTTTKTLTIEVQRDTTKPTLEASGSLFEAPEGWVEQQNYSLTGKAADGGAGATQLKLMIDGQQAGIATQTCANGGCSLNSTFTIDTSKYPGGAHEAELIATDGAGNATTKKWTINVDPEGKISVLEAEHTLEAADATSESTVVAPTSEVLEPEQIEGGDNPGLKLSGSAIESTGVPDTTTMTTDPEDGFTIHSSEAATTITPIVNESSSSISITEGVAGVAANVANEADSVIRPEYNGVQIAQAVRSDASPERYSWRVHLGPQQKLRLANPTQAEVFYEDGTVSFLITAEPAHDATGASVPITLEVEGEILTVKVEFHTKSFVYPIVSGQAWETSYTVPVVVEGPEDETEIQERERKEREEEEAEFAAAENSGAPDVRPTLPLTLAQAKRMIRPRVRNFNTAAPPYTPARGASASNLRTFTVDERYVCAISNCSKYKLYIRNPSYERGLNWARWENGTQVHCGYSQDPWYYLVFPVGEHGCGFYEPPYIVYKCDSQPCHTQHLTIWSRFTVSFPAKEGLPYRENIALQVWVWPNGFQQEHVGSWE